MSDQLLANVNPAEAWETWQPSRSQPWDVRWVAHMYRRAAFGADWDALEAGASQRPAEVVDRLLEGGEGTDQFYEAAEKKTKRLAERPIPDPTELQGLWLER